MAAMYSWEGWVLHKEGEKRELKFHLGFTKVLSREKGRRVLRYSKVWNGLAAALEKPEVSF